MSKIKILIKIQLYILITLFFFTAYYGVLALGSCGQDQVCLDPPLKVNDPNLLIGQIINAVMGIVGSLALVMFIYGGLTWMLAAGNNEKVQKGKNILVWAMIGLVVIFSSYALVRFVFSGLGA